ncbi:MAG: hypothetical protein PVG26_22875 [Desulfobacterales bacterium]|jgi:hypothetical protein
MYQFGRGIHRVGTRAAEKHMVDPFGQFLHQLSAQFLCHGAGVAHEAVVIGQPFHLLIGRGDQSFIVKTKGCASKTGYGVRICIAFGVGNITPLTFHDGFGSLSYCGDWIGKRIEQGHDDLL